VTRAIVVLGSTGSVGTQALDIVRQHPGRFRVAGLAAGGGRPELLARQALECGAEVVAVSKASAAEDVQLALYAEASRRGFAKGEFAVPKLLA
jgi:1-deoxy-D-xylulose-5-phosphate reductoisomerase